MRKFSKPPKGASQHQSRRQFLQQALLLSGSLPFSSLSSGKGAYNKGFAPEYARESASGAASDPREPNWRLGRDSIVENELPSLPLTLEGNIPAGLEGIVLRNGPARHDRGGQRYDHWFDGDGMLQQFTIAKGKIAHRARYIQTEKYQREQAAGKFLLDGAGTHFADAKPGRNNDSGNTANTALEPWGDEVLALWEGGSAYRVDPVTLTTQGIKTWRDDLAHMPFSAHPLRESDGSLWNFGFAPYAAKNGLIVIYLAHPSSGLRQIKTIPLPFGGYMHDFAMSEKYLAFLLPPYHWAEDSGLSFVDSFRWEPSLGSRLLLVEKDNLDRQQWFDLPAGFVFHFGPASEVAEEVHIQLCWYETPDIMATGMRQLMHSGDTDTPMHAFASTVIANLHTGEARLERSDTMLEFPVFAGGTQQKSTVVFGAGIVDADSATERESLCAWTPGTGTTDQYVYRYGTIAEEPLWIPKAGGDSRDGWLVQTSLDCIAGRTALSIFDSRNLSAGPIAVASMPRALPLGFHGTFLPNLRG